MKCICFSRNLEANNTTFKHSSTPKPQYPLSQQKKFSANNYNSRKKITKISQPKRNKIQQTNHTKTYKFELKSRKSQTPKP
jgi:hypothetical protein